MKADGIVVTGGGSGIGAAVARLAAKRGATVVILDLRDSDHVANASGIHYLACDVTQPSALETAMAEARSFLGAVNGVFVNAGINGMQAPLEELTPDEWRQTLAICLDGSFFTIRAAVPHLREHGGSIVITSSITGTRSFATEGAAAYATAKGGLAALGKLAAVELGRYAIRVNVVAPGGVLDTRLWDERTQLRNLDALAHRRHIDAPLATAATTSSDVANLVVFLLSDDARRISGAVIHIDGAQSLLGGGVLKESRRIEMEPPKGSGTGRSEAP